VYCNKNFALNTNFIVHLFADVLNWETYFLGVFIYLFIYLFIYYVAMLNWGNTVNAVAGSLFRQKLLSNNLHLAEMANMSRKLKYVEFEAEIL